MKHQPAKLTACENITFSAHSSFKYRWCGKFTSPSDEWMHMNRNLGDYELMVVTDGTLYIGNHQEEFVVETGEYLLMPPTPFQHGTRSSRCSFYWLHFDFLKDSLSGISSEDQTILPMKGQLPSLDRIKIMMKELQDSDRRYHNRLLNNSLTGAIVAELYCQAISSSSKNPNSPAKNSTVSKNSFANTEKEPSYFRREQLLEEVATYIRWHIQENISIFQIANEFGYNEKYLTTLFKKYHGISLKQYMLQTKMEHAKASLSETNLPVSHIAYSLGFSDAHNFSNAFRKVAGLSPSEYRSIYSKQNVFQV